MRKVHASLPTFKDGDYVSHYNVIYRLKNRRTRPCPKGDDPSIQGDIILFDTDVIEFVEGPVPRRWADTWVFQGNNLAFFAHLVDYQPPAN